MMKQSSQDLKLEDIARQFPIFGEQKLEQIDEWIFFGGSFNPWHQGHSGCLELLYQEQKKEAIVVPDHNPQKVKRTITSPLEYYQQLSNNVSQMLTTPFTLYPGFLTRQTTNPTVDWISHIKQIHPEQKLSLLMGNDSFCNLPTWIRWKELCQKLFSLYVVSREDDSQETYLTEKQIKTIAPKLSIVYLGNHPYEHLNSTELRQSKN